MNASAAELLAAARASVPVVLIHGVGLDASMWEPFVEHFDRRCITYDMLGLGRADRPRGPYSLEMYVDQLAAIIDGVGDSDGASHGEVDLVGFSMGALVAGAFTASFGHRVRRLVLVSAVYDRTPAERAAILERVDNVRSGGYVDSIEPALQRWFTSAFAHARPDEISRVRHRMITNDVTSYADAYEVFATADAELVAGAVPFGVDRIKAPTLCATGEQDQRSTPLMSQRCAGAIPNGRVVVIPGVRHLVPIEAPAALAALVIAFLNEPVDS